MKQAEKGLGLRWETYPVSDILMVEKVVVLVLFDGLSREELMP